MMVMDIVIVLEYFGPTFMLNQFKLNIFINGIAVESSSLLACLVDWYMIHRYSRKAVAIVSFD